MNFKTKQITRIAIVASLYVVLTVGLAPISYGVIQFRISELLNFLAFIDGYYVISLTIGCFISNLVEGNIIVSIIGATVTLISTFMIYKSKTLFKASLWPMLNGPILAVTFYYIYELPILPTMISITLSEFIIMTVLGYPVVKKIFKQEKLVDQLKIK